MTGKVELFQASDGKYFADRDDWEAYEKVLGYKEEVAQYINGQELGRSQATRNTNVIVEYLLYREGISEVPEDVKVS